jgi:fatty-acyl-CoA synthase
MGARTAMRTSKSQREVQQAPGGKPDPGNLTIGLMLRDAAQREPHSLALVMGDDRLNWAELYVTAHEYARALLGIGVKPGAHIGILMPNAADYLLLVHAASLIGARALTINARYKQDDLRYVIDHADVEHLFIGGHAMPYSDFRTMLAGIHPELAAWDGKSPLALAGAPKLRTLHNFADPRETTWPGRDTFLVAGREIAVATLDALAETIDPASVALMMFSSGTTARPKACMLTHRSINLAGVALAERFRLTPEDRVYDPLPFFHMSTMLPFAACRASGAAFIGAMHFDAGEALATIERERATVSYTSFPTIVSGMTGHPDFATRDLSSIRLIHCVGPAELLKRYSGQFPQAYFVNAYGLTEATGVPVWSDPDDPQQFSFTTSGRPFAGVDVKTVDPETLEDLPHGGRGEIWLRGYVVFDGYYKDEEGTSRTIRPDGWLRTGDLGFIDPDGRVVYDGRLKDMLKIGGENVAALEVETWLCSHPDVQIAQVIAVPDDHLFEVAAAYVEVKPGSSITPLDLVDHCIGSIATYKVPRYVRFVTEWPMSATKIQKYKLDRDFQPAEKVDVRAREQVLKARRAS